MGLVKHTTMQTHEHMMAQTGDREPTDGGKLAQVKLPTDLWREARVFCFEVEPQITFRKLMLDALREYLAARRGSGSRAA